MKGIGNASKRLIFAQGFWTRPTILSQLLLKNAEFRSVLPRSTLRLDPEKIWLQLDLIIKTMIFQYTGGPFAIKKFKNKNEKA